MKNKKKMGIPQKIILIIIAVLAIGYAGIMIYVNDDYPANELAQKALQPDEQVMVEYMEDETVLFIPTEPFAALIFYPGGKVDYEAYAPLMRAYAQEGILCILPEMPLQLAVLDSNAAERYRDLYPEIDTWYIGGHSLGGAMAASHVGEHVEEYDGLVLLASYSTADLSAADLNVISIYGTNDQVMNREKYEEYRSYLPEDFSEIVIEGGCHAYFGSYGVQKGDGEPSVTNMEQIEETVQITLDMMRRM